jgi:hypothetical protein
VDLSIVRFAAGSGNLGPWGSLRLTGASSAVIKATNCDDIELPAPVAEDLPGGATVLNEAKGRLLFLPYAGEIVAGIDLAEGGELFPPMTIPRDQDAGMRIADYRLVGIGGVIYLTEGSLLRFGENLLLSWRYDEDFTGWSFEGVSHHEIWLTAGDWTGREERQIRSLDNGQRIP